MSPAPAAAAGGDSYIVKTEGGRYIQYSVGSGTLYNGDGDALLGEENQWYRIYVKDLEKDDTRCTPFGAKEGLTPCYICRAVRIDKLYHEVKAGETLSGIARQYEVSVRCLAMFNHLTSQDEIFAHTTLKIPHSLNIYKTDCDCADVKQYLVRQGDTLASIAAAHSMSLECLNQLNYLVSEVIFPGQVLFVK